MVLGGSGWFWVALDGSGWFRCLALPKPFTIGGGIDRRLYHFFKLIRSHSPEYLISEIPPEHQVMYNLRKPRVYDENIVRTVCFSNTYFQNALHEWNLLEDEKTNLRSISEFKGQVRGWYDCRYDQRLRRCDWCVVLFSNVFSLFSPKLRVSICEMCE